MRLHLVDRTAPTPKAEAAVAQGRPVILNGVTLTHVGAQFHDKGDGKDRVHQGEDAKRKANGQNQANSPHDGVDHTSVALSAGGNFVGLPVETHALEELSEGDALAAPSVPKDALADVAAASAKLVALGSTRDGGLVWVGEGERVRIS